MITVFDPIYHQPDASLMTSTNKQLQVVKSAFRRGLISSIIKPGMATPEMVTKVHDPKFVKAVATGKPLELAESQGFTWSPEYGRSLFTIFGGQVVACRMALERAPGEMVFHPCSGAHHATYSSGAAFCTFNFLAGAPLPLLESGRIEKVLIIDLDEHQGNGTHSIIEDDPRFAEFDISGCNFGVGELDTHRHFFKVVSTRAQYFKALERLPKMLDAFEPDLVEYQAGMDCADDDGGPYGMNEEALRLRDRYVFEEVFVKRHIPCTWNLAGGYLDDGRTVRFHVNTVEEALAAEQQARKREDRHAAL
jgi:acetoin utilization deacetylase AcuC-like enzyme